MRQSENLKPTVAWLTQQNFEHAMGEEWGYAHEVKQRNTMWISEGLWQTKMVRRRQYANAGEQTYASIKELLSRFT